MTTAINELKNEEEIFRKALDLLTESAETEEDFLHLTRMLDEPTNYIPLMTTNRGAYNLNFEINELFKKYAINNWKTFTQADDDAVTVTKLLLADCRSAEFVIEMANEYAKEKLNGMTANPDCTPKDIVLEMYKITDSVYVNISKKLEHIEDLAKLYETLTIIRAFKHLQKARNFTVNMKKLRGVFLELKVDENGEQYIRYEVMIKKGRPKNRHFVKVKSFKGKITTI